MAKHRRLRPSPAEDAFGLLAGHRLARAREQERRLGAMKRGGLRSLMGRGGQGVIQAWTNGPPARLVKLARVNGQQVGGAIDIGHGQSERFTDAQGRPIQQKEQGAHRRGREPRAGILTGVHRLQQLLQVLRRVDIRREDDLELRCRRWQGGAGHLAPPDRTPIQALHRAMLAMPKAGDRAMTGQGGVDVLRGDLGDGQVANALREGLEDDRF